MNPDRTREIIQALADGVDLYTGERFSDDSPYQPAAQNEVLDRLRHEMGADYLETLKTQSPPTKSSSPSNTNNPNEPRRLDYALCLERLYALSCLRQQSDSEQHEVVCNPLSGLEMEKIMNDFCIGKCPHCGAINALSPGRLRESSADVQEMVANGLKVEDPGISNVTLKWCEHCQPVSPNIRFDRLFGCFSLRPKASTMGNDTVWLRREVVLSNRYGIHNRPAGNICRLAIRYESEIIIGVPNRITLDGRDIVDDHSWKFSNARDIMGLLLLEASHGTKLQIFARGPDAYDALEELRSLLERGFDMSDD